MRNTKINREKMEKKNLLVMPGLLPPPYGGIATYLSHTLPRLVSKGYKVHALLPHGYGDSKAYERFINQGISIHYTREPGSNHITKILQLIRKPISFLKNILMFSRYYKNTKLGYIFFLKYCIGLLPFVEKAEEIIVKHNIDVIHVYDIPWIYGFVGAFLSTRYNIKYIQTIFGFVVPYEDELNRHDGHGLKYIPLVNQVLNKADLLISLSNHCAEEVEYVNIPKSRVIVNRWGTDVSGFKPGSGGNIREKYSLEKNKIILFVGQVRARKGPQVLIDAAPAILEKFPSTKFLIVGPDFGIVSQLKSQISRLGIEDNVIFIDGIDNDKLPEYYNASDIFVFPTCTDIECLGLSMIQAMACAMPIVASDIDGIPEVLIDKVTGLLAKPGDADDLSEKVIDLLSNPERAKKFGEAARERAEKHFNRDSLVDELLQIYKKL